MHLDKTIDLGRLFSAVSTFIGARIENRRLIKRLEWAGERDPLTGLLNRRGSEVAIRKFHAENHDAPLAMLVHKADEECALLFASTQLTQLPGCDSLHELMQFSGRSFKGIVHPDDRDRIHAYYKRIADEGDTDASDRIDYRMLTQSGEAKNVRAIARFVRIEDVGEVFYTLFMPAGR